MEEIAEAGRAPLPLSRSTGSTQILIVPLPVIGLVWLPSIGVQYIRLIATVAYQCCVGVLLHLLSTPFVHRPVARVPVPLVAVVRRDAGLVGIVVVRQLLLRI
jgi:hypothetical protein